MGLDRESGFRFILWGPWIYVSINSKVSRNFILKQKQQRHDTIGSSSSGDHECLCQMSWKTPQIILTKLHNTISLFLWTLNSKSEGTSTICIWTLHVKTLHWRWCRDGIYISAVDEFCAHPHFVGSSRMRSFSVSWHVLPLQDHHIVTVHLFHPAVILW